MSILFIGLVATANFNWPYGDISIEWWKNAIIISAITSGSIVLFVLILRIVNNHNTRNASNYFISTSVSIQDSKTSRINSQNLLMKQSLAYQISLRQQVVTSAHPSIIVQNSIQNSIQNSFQNNINGESSNNNFNCNDDVPTVRVESIQDSSSQSQSSSQKMVSLSHSGSQKRSSLSHSNSQKKSIILARTMSQTKAPVTRNSTTGSTALLGHVSFQAHVRRNSDNP
jgi:hypothetical protein